MWSTAPRRVPGAWSEEGVVRFAGIRQRGTGFYFPDLPLAEEITAKVKERDANLGVTKKASRSKKSVTPLMTPNPLILKHKAKESRRVFSLV